MPPHEVRIGPHAWDEVIRSTDGPQLVVAGPGAGKTEFLVRRALHLIVDLGVHPEQVLILSFSRRGAADLRTRLTTGLRRSFTAIPASTFHSFAYRLVETYGGVAGGPSTVPALLTGPEQVALVADLLAEEQASDWPVLYRGMLQTGTFANEVADFILRCREQLIDPAELAERAVERPQWRALPRFLERYTEALQKHRRIDYGTLQARAVELLADEEVSAHVAAQYRYLLVDEYQDTTVAQARFLERLYRYHRNLAVAGDPYQSIYSFRGAEVSNIAEFPRRFPDAAGAPARRIVLTTSFRVPSEILDAAVRVTAGGRLPGAAGPVTPAPGRGSVEAYGFDQLTHEAEWIAAELQRIRLRDGIPYHRMAVLVRSKRRFLPELSRSLERRGIPHDPPDTRLADHPAVRQVLDCVRAATGDGPDRNAALRRILLGSLMGLSLSSVRELERMRARTDSEWGQLLDDRVPGGSPLARLLEDPRWAEAMPAAEGFWHLWSTLPQFAAAVAKADRAGDRAAWSSLAQVLGRLGERDPRATLQDYLRWSENEDFEATPLLEFGGADADRLTLTTLHQAKGMEFDVVVIADAREGVFPDLRPRESLLESRRLSTPHGEGADQARFRLQEEMRLAYTAISRATTRVIWTCTTSGFEDGRGIPSRFLHLVAGVPGFEGGLPSPTESPLPATPVEAEAWLRRMLRDPAEPEPRRLAALSALTGPGSWKRREATSFAGVLPRGSDRGLVPSALDLSPTQAEAYLTCPRLYAFRRRLHIDAEGSVYLDFGSLVHGVLEEIEDAARRRGDPHATVDEAVFALEDRFDPGAFGGGPWAAAWHRRAVSVLTHLYEAWPSPGRVIEVERNVGLDLDGIRWRGRIDRVEMVDTPGGVPRLKIVDYKTGKTPIRNEDAAVSVQLGFYVLAARADPQLCALGDVGGAEFWFPAAKGKAVVVRPFDLDRLGDVVDRMAVAAAGIRSEDWTPQTGRACERCPVRNVCPEWPEGREAYLG